MKYPLLFLLFISTSAAFSQNYRSYKASNSASISSLAKVKSLIAGIDGNTYNYKLNDNDYQTLSIREKIMYTMICAEQFSQNCGAPRFRDHDEEKVFSYIDQPYPERAWSKRQLGFLSSNRDSLMFFIKESVADGNSFESNYKVALHEINAVEMIPFIVKYFKKDPRDTGILTLLMLLMKDNKFQPFQDSELYAELYGPEKNSRSFTTFDKKIEEFIINKAMDFYQKSKLQR